MVPLDLVPETVSARSVRRRGAPAEDAVERWVSGEIRARRRAGRRRARRIRQQYPLRVVEGHHQVSSPLADVSNLEGGISGKLVLDSHVPLIRDRRLNLGIPDSKETPLRNRRTPPAQRTRLKMPLPTIPSVELVGGSKAPDAVVELISAGVNGGFNVKRRFVPVPSR